MILIGEKDKLIFLMSDGHTNISYWAKTYNMLYNINLSIGHG
jgi:hypothetical protein